MTVSEHGTSTNAPEAPDEARDRWYPSAPADLIARLLQRRANANLIKLVLFERTMAEVRPACDSRRDFERQRRWWQLVDRGMAATVLRSPSFDHWVYLADCCRRRYDNNEPVTWDDLSPYREFETGGEDAVVWLLRDFGRFTLDLALAAGTEAEGSAVVFDGHLTLGHHGIRIAAHSPGRLRWSLVRNGACLFLSSDGFTNRNPILVEGRQLVTADGLTQASRILMPGNTGIVVSADEPLVRREWVDAYVNPDGSRYLAAPEDLGPFANNYERGLQLINRYMPQLAKDIGAGLHTIIPVGKPAADRGVSCSSDTFFAAILCCDNPPVLCAEVLIHEFGHNVFNELLARDSVFAAELPEDEVLYSPWREDPRPILGLFHGAFVFERVCQFYAAYVVEHPGDEAAVSRYRLLLASTRIACRSLNAANAYGPFGKMLLEGMIARTDHLATQASARLQHSEASAIQQHFAAWCERNPVIAARNAFEMPV